MTLPEFLKPVLARVNRRKKMRELFECLNIGVDLNEKIDADKLYLVLTDKESLKMFIFKLKNKAFL